jgi:hypothetical protein
MKFTVELPSGSQLDFETPEALERALGAMKGGTPLVVRDERDGSKQVLWAPGDEG